MGGSFNQRRVADIIRASQQEWRTGYEQGKKGIKPFGADSWRASFRDGFYRGRDEFLGKGPQPLPLAPPRNPQEIADQQKERGRHMAKQGLWVNNTELEKCHPDFRRSYQQVLDDEERCHEELSEYRYNQDNQYN